MSNALNEDITNRYVVIREGLFKPEYDTIENRIFLAEGGFGCLPFTAGTAVIGKTPVDGESFRVEGHEVERFATDEEIALVVKEGS